jgi:hypothetical protein
VAGDRLYANANGDLVPWADLDEAEQPFYVNPLAGEIVEHMCRFWREAALTELYFENASAVPD